MADGPEWPEDLPLPRIAIFLRYNGGITDIHCECLGGPIEVVIATQRLDGELTGRPITMLATPNGPLVDKVFRRAAHTDDEGPYKDP